MTRTTALLLSVLILYVPYLAAQTGQEGGHSFDDSPLAFPLEYPNWFKKSFLHLADDLNIAIQNGKKGLVVYFGQPRCPYCEQLIKTNFGQDDIAHYTQQHFDLIPIDIHGIETVTDLQGQRISERDFSVRENANFTPTLIFYNQKGEKALALRGYYPPYTFQAALEYVAGDHYQQETFAAYLERSANLQTFEIGALNEQPFFIPAPHLLDRSKRAGERPLVVFFEQRDCHACDILHAEPLQEHEVRNSLRQMDTVQLDINSDAHVITPTGEMTSARRWAQSLGLFYSPTLLFFDRQGREIIRLDSVAHFHRIRNLLQFILEEGYQHEPNYLRWRMGLLHDPTASQ